jgi:hypothetical protein
LSENDITDQPYRVIGDVSVRVRKVGVIDRPPIKQKVQNALRNKAAGMGADAVIEVRADAGMLGGFGGSVTGTGKAVQFISGSAAAQAPSPSTEASLRRPTPEEEPAIKQRIAAAKPDLERQTLLLQVITGEQNGDLMPAIRSPVLLRATTEQWPAIQESQKRLGKFKSLQFLHVDQRGWDVYDVTFENGQAIYRVGPLTPDHKLQGLLEQP